MADGKQREQKEEYHSCKSKGCQQKERLHKWEEHVKNLLRNSLEITYKIINNQLDIKLGQFTEEELDAVLKEKKAEKM